MNKYTIKKSYTVTSWEDVYAETEEEALQEALESEDWEHGTPDSAEILEITELSPPGEPYQGPEEPGSRLIIDTSVLYKNINLDSLKPGYIENPNNIWTDPDGNPQIGLSTYRYRNG